MADLSPYLKLLEDALTAETRKERRNLLIASAVGIAIVKAGLIPKKVSALGIDADVNETGLLWVLTGVTAYFLIAFLVYAYSDFQKHMYTLGHEIRSRVDKFNESHEEYKFRETSDGRVLMQTYIPITPDMEELLRLQAQTTESVNSYKSDEVKQLADERGRVSLFLKNCEYRMNRKTLKGKARETAERERDELRASLKDLTRMLTALGATQVIELQDSETSLNARIADSTNRTMENYYDEIGLDFDTTLKFLPAAFLKFCVDFLIPIGTAIFAIVCLLRGR